LLNKYRKERKNFKMKKNVFSRTLAVLASTAVLGAASMITANAAGESLSLSSASGLPGDTVQLTVDVACNNNFESLDVVVNWEDTALTSGTAMGANGVSVASANGDGYCTVVAYGSAAIADGAVATIDFTIPADAEPGTVYNVEFGTITTYAIFGGDDLGSGVANSGGTITVDAPATEPPTEPTTEPTTEPATEPATTVETTAAPTTTTAAATTKAPSTGAPKTGNAGVAVAVAGLVAAGATAVVLKKRH
jgi:LPXTG-motif cell wall-anchored protein